MTQMEERQLSKELAGAIAMSLDVCKLAKIIKNKIQPIPPDPAKSGGYSTGDLFGQATELREVLKESLDILEWANRQL